MLIVRDAPGGDDKFFYSELYPRLLGRPWASCARDEETIGARQDLGVAVAATPIAYRSDQPFDTLDEACEFWMTWMGLEGASARTFLEEFLAGRLVRDGHGWLAPYRKRATVIFWRV